MVNALTWQSVFHLPNSALSLLFGFVSAVFVVLGRVSDFCKEIAAVFPRTLFTARNNHSRRFKFRRYVVCRKCHRLSFLKDSIEGTGSAERTKVCSFRRFPNHVQRRMRAICACPLLKTVELSGGRRILYPYLTYCYLSLETSLQSFVTRQGFLQSCEEWRNLERSDDICKDVYDGRVWKDFQVYEGTEFLQAPNNLALMMNMDFFRPYKHVQYSVGAIYLTVLNLPRSMRYKQENVILSGLIPGPREPELLAATSG